MIKKNILVGGLVSLVIASNLFGAKVTVFKPSVAEETFQTLVVSEILKKMGHDVTVTNAVGYNISYQTIASNANSKDVYFAAYMWDPLHSSKLKALGGDKKIVTYAPFISNCAQGYLIDKKTADKYNIKYFNDLSKPEIAKLFDTNGNGKANLTGCNPGWGCEKVIEYQLDAYNLRDTVEHDQGEYSALIANTIANYKTNKSILFYTWTPYWVSGKLVPGKDVVFLQVTSSAHPVVKSTELSNGANYGFVVNNQRIIANTVTKEHKDIAKLFEIMKISVNDISGENMLMSKGENKEKDIKRHAKMWVKQNQATIDTWIKEAKAAL